MLRWLYHIARIADVSETGPYVPASLSREGFVHGSFLPDVRESARLYFPSTEGLCVLQIDPRRLDARVDLAATPRGTMPHIHGAIPRDAIRSTRAFADFDGDTHGADPVLGTRIAFVAFTGMTLLDLVGVLDPLSRIATMSFDPSTVCEVVSADVAAVHREASAVLTVDRVRPDLGDFDLVVIPGGRGARAALADSGLLAWLRGYPSNRWIASVCTGALLLGALGRLRGLRATTHASEIDRLAEFGAVASRERVVDEGHVVTAGGVTSGIDLGLHLVERLCGSEVARRVAGQMEYEDVFRRAVSERRG